MNPIVSVIITCYNQADTIGKAIESVIEQTAPFPFEIILGEDCSTDSTRAVCREYAEKYPEVIRLMPEAPNKGIVDNYFDCLLAAKGKYITDCAGDDYWNNATKLEKMVAILESNPNANVVFSDWIIENETDGTTLKASETATHRQFMHNGIDRIALLKRVLNHRPALPYNLTTALYRKADVMKIYATHPATIRNKEYRCEDVPVMAALASSGDAMYFDEPTLTYKVLADSISHQVNPAKDFTFHIGTLRASRELGQFYGVRQEEMTDIFAEKCNHLTSLAFNSGDENYRKRLTEEISQWHLPIPVKARIQFRLMGNRNLWSVSLAAKNAVKRFL